MSGEGAPRLQVRISGSLRVGIVAATWHKEITDGLLAGARRALDQCRARDYTVVRVPGSFELPVVVGQLAEHGYDAIVALGVIIRGGTPHFDYVCQGTTAGLMQVSVRTGVPVGFGVLTCDTEQQARDRAGLAGSREDKGYDAALAALATAVTLRQLREGAEQPGADTVGDTVGDTLGGTAHKPVDGTGR